MPQDKKITCVFICRKKVAQKLHNLKMTVMFHKKSSLENLVFSRVFYW